MKGISLLPVLISLFVLVNVKAQPPELWSRCYGGSGIDMGTSVRQTSDGGYIIAGYTSSNDGDVSGNHGLDDFWIMKTDENGFFQWQKCYGGTDYDRAKIIRQTSDGGYIVAGITSSNDGDVTGLHSALSDFWIVKTDSIGTLQWQKTLGGSGEEGNMLMNGEVRIAQTSNGSYLVGGSTKSNDGDVTGNHGDYDYWLAKLDFAGNLLWQKCYGGSLEERFKDMVLTQDGGVIMAGWTYSNDGDVTGNTQLIGSWIVRTDSLGALQWQKFYVCIDTLDTTCNGKISVTSIVQKGPNEFLSAGLVYFFGNHFEYSTTILNDFGNVVSSQWYPLDIDHTHNLPSKLNITSSNGFLISGCRGPACDMYVLKGGIPSWSFIWGHSQMEEVASEAIESSDGGFLIIGNSSVDSLCNFFEFASPELQLIKLGGIVSTSELEVAKEFMVRLDQNSLAIFFNAKEADMYQVTVNDLQGRLLISLKIDAEEGSNQVDERTKDIENGIYIITIRNKWGILSKKVAKL